MLGSVTGWETLPFLSLSSAQFVSALREAAREVAHVHSFSCGLALFELHKLFLDSYL